MSDQAKFATIEQIKQANADAGLYYFEPATMRFFSSRVLKTVYGGRYFVTSEQQGAEYPRLYTVREASADGRIDTVGAFQAYANASQAKAAARRLASELA